MLDILNALSETSVPTLLMGLGAILLLLAFVQKIGTHIELPESRQRAAAVVGVLLLALGTLVTVAPQIAALQATAPDPPPPGDVPETPAKTEPRKAEERSPDETISLSASPPNSARKSDGADTASGEDGSSDREPVYNGSLRSVMPDIALLPAEMRFWSDDVRDIDDRLKYTGKERAAARALLREANFKGYELKYDSDCNPGIPVGEIRHAIFQVDRFDTAEQSAAWWRLPQSDGSPSEGSFNEWLPDHDSTFAESFTRCGSASALAHWRSLRVGNLTFHVGLFTSDRGPNNPAVAQLAKDLILSMAAKVPGSGF